MLTIDDYRRWLHDCLNIEGSISNIDAITNITDENQEKRKTPEIRQANYG